MRSGETLRAICRDDGMPHRTTVMRWADDDAGPGFRDQYARARDAGLDAIADEIIELSDECREGQKIKTLPDGKEEITTGDMVDRSRLQIDARKWYLSKLAPKRYSDRLAVEHSGALDISVLTERLAAGRKRLAAGEPDTPE